MDDLDELTLRELVLLLEAIDREVDRSRSSLNTTVSLCGGCQQMYRRNVNHRLDELRRIRRKVSDAFDRRPIPA